MMMKIRPLVLFPINGKKVKAEDGDIQKGKTINGKKYEFDENGVMTAEWSLDVKAASKAGVRDKYSSATTNSNAKYCSVLICGDTLTG